MVARPSHQQRWATGATTHRSLVLGSKRSAVWPLDACLECLDTRAPNYAWPPRNASAVPRHLQTRPAAWQPASTQAAWQPACALASRARPAPRRVELLAAPSAAQTQSQMRACGPAALAPMRAGQAAPCGPSVNGSRCKSLRPGRATRAPTIEHLAHRLDGSRARRAALAKPRVLPLVATRPGLMVSLHIPRFRTAVPTKGSACVRGPTTERRSPCVRHCLRQVRTSKAAPGPRSQDIEAATLGSLPACPLAPAVLPRLPIAGQALRSVVACSRRSFERNLLCQRQGVLCSVSTARQAELRDRDARSC